MTIEIIGLLASAALLLGSLAVLAAGLLSCGLKRCQMCGEFGAVRYRQRTSYHDDEQNWVTLCPPCRVENDQHWDDMWADYYSGLL